MSRDSFFQYPTTGRCQCDGGRVLVERDHAHFQYPTTGRCQCDGLAASGLDARSTPFSTLPRVDASVTARAFVLVSGHSRPFSTLPRVDASVTPRQRVHGADRERFQYPTTGRCQCDLLAPATWRSTRLPFSTLPRVDASVTPRRPHWPRPSGSFSTLPRVDASVTRQIARCPLHGLPFQYPTTGRCQCDCVQKSRSCGLVKAFSTLPRVDASVTSR